jgi:cytochrome oxidase assembly protein ShyY1
LSYFKLSYRRWLAWLALAILFAVACWFLSQWQFARRAQVVAAIEQLDANYGMPPIDLPTAQAGKPDSLKWRPVKVSGIYLLNELLLVRNRPSNGNPGFEQLIPLKTADGTVVFVNRGWLPTGNQQDKPDVNPLPVSSQVTIVGNLMPSEPLTQRGAPSGQLPVANGYLAARQLGFPVRSTVRSFYLRLISETPAAEKSPKAFSKPQITEGNHLSYALQWLIFGLLAFTALGLAIRKEAMEYRAVHDPTYSPKPKRVTQAKRDEEAEDAANAN